MQGLVGMGRTWVFTVRTRAETTELVLGQTMEQMIRMDGGDG